MCVCDTAGALRGVCVCDTVGALRGLCVCLCVRVLLSDHKEAHSQSPLCVPVSATASPATHLIR